MAADGGAPANDADGGPDATLIVLSLVVVVLAAVLAVHLWRLRQRLQGRKASEANAARGGDRGEAVRLKATRGAEV